MTRPLDELVNLLTLEPLGGDRWLGIGSTNDGAPGTYGGHLIGQATSAALASVDQDRMLHSIHAYFLRGGEPGVDYEYHVTRVRDGRSFSNRRVTAMQHGRPVFELTASLAVPEAGRTLSAKPPPDFNELPAPESLPPYHEVMAKFDPPLFPAEWALREHGIDLRPIDAPWCDGGPSDDGGIRHWIRANGKAPNDSRLHTAMLAYQSDESLADSILIPFDVNWGTPGTTLLSLDHAMWFHRPVDINEWMLIEQWPATAENARGLAHGRIWSSQGNLIASMSQEGLLRLD